MITTLINKKKYIKPKVNNLGTIKSATKAKPPWAPGPPPWAPGPPPWAPS